MASARPFPRKEAGRLALFLLILERKVDMKKRKLYSFTLSDTERKLLERMSKVEKGKMNYSKTVARLIQDEASRTGLVQENKK
jgi:hypothetical protein